LEALYFWIENWKTKDSALNTSSSSITTARGLKIWTMMKSSA